MKCFDCSIQGRAEETIGICHHCSAGVCESHGSLVSDPVTMQALILRTIILPKKARLLLCRTCREALGQPHDLEAQEGTG
jgi:hypothetical protein